MGRRTKRSRPSSPAEAAARYALQRGQKAQQERRVRTKPELWGIPKGIELLAANEDLKVTRDPQQREKVIRARRSDAFSLVSLTDDQARAADRYLRTWMERIGVKIDDIAAAPFVDRSPGLAPGQGVTQRMIDAGRRLELVHRLVGRANARLLETLADPIVKGQPRVWRVLVEQATGETQRDAQAFWVKAACQNLHESWPEVDEFEKARRERRSAIEERQAPALAEDARLASPYAGGGGLG